ncbi:MAG: HlyD family efflux transporter periplasmic adaptor subunit [Dechloromonas sp.]|uniref:efflux RND transporter periplasmic adaptor subunit n=1 Tax=Dechloromonas sp. TaxID=1917218 RepID=UPI0027FFEE94|nr:HlyD family efflux transporter periplasmic adaptor subunit [Dechloromonas sp.]MBT9520943.1 HlyD family efflux transporter periplasmic adaptor subunit [Dechloromonas sp.]
MTIIKNFSRYALALFVGSTLAVQVSAHGGEDHGDAPKSPAAPAPVAAVNAQGQVTFNEPAIRLPDGSIFVPKSAQRQLSLRTRAALKGEFPRTVELNGRIIADPNAGGRVQTFQSGRIEAGPNGLAVLGQRVKKGQILAWLQPAATALERGTQQSVLAELAAQESVLERRLARLKQLEGSVPQKDIEQAEIELAAFKKRKNAVGGSLGREALVAPVTGVVSAANAAVGQVVDAREVVFEVIDPQRLAVEALAYDPLLLDGLGKASAPIAGGVLDLAFVGLGRTLKDQAMPVLFRVQVPKNGDLPAVAVGQTLKVLAQTKASQAGVSIPAAAVVRNAANESVVWVHESAERFVSRKVKAAALDGHSVAVTDGLSGGERVVVQGAAALAQIR